VPSTLHGLEASDILDILKQSSYEVVCNCDSRCEVDASDFDNKCFLIVLLL
jgi:hypothetical protein